MIEIIEKNAGINLDVSILYPNRVKKNFIIRLNKKGVCSKLR